MPLVLRNERAVATIDPDLGGRLRSLSIDGVDIIGSSEPQAGLPSTWFSGCFPMVPYVGRMAHGTFAYDGESYRMPINAAPHAGHGLLLDTRWHIVASDQMTTLVLETALPGTWPFGGMARLSYRLDAWGLELALELRATDEPMPAAIGFHPWFRNGSDSGAKASVGFAPRRRYLPDDDGIPRFPSADLGSGPYDDVFDGVDRFPTIRWNDGPSIVLESDAPLWILCEKENAFCLEPITGLPNSVNLPDPTIVTVDRPLALSLKLRWGL